MRLAHKAFSTPEVFADGTDNAKWKTSDELDELDRRERAARELEDRSKQLEAEAEAKAKAMVAMKEKEIEDKRKAHVNDAVLRFTYLNAETRSPFLQEAEQKQLAEKRRRVP